MEPARLQFFRSGNLRIALPSLCFGGHLMVRTGMVAGLDCRLPPYGMLEGSDEGGQPT